jgi:hypothetical protein
MFPGRHVLAGQGTSHSILAISTFVLSAAMKIYTTSLRLACHGLTVSTCSNIGVLSFPETRGQIASFTEKI